MRALIIAHGSIDDADFLLHQSRAFDLVIVTDGAIQTIPPEVSPDIVCGDFDSIPVEHLETLRARMEVVPLIDQELSDLEKALLLARVRGVTEVTLVGAFGGRIDHSLANVGVLIRYHRELSVTMIHQGASMRIVSGSQTEPSITTFQAEDGEILSILPLSLYVRISASGVAWPLNNEIVWAGTRGVSNRAVGGAVSIEIFEGHAAICCRITG